MAECRGEVEFVNTLFREMRFMFEQEGVDEEVDALEREGGSNDAQGQFPYGDWDFACSMPWNNISAVLVPKRAAMMVQRLSCEEVLLSTFTEPSLMQPLSRR